MVADENGTTTTDGGSFAKIGSIGGGDEGEIADVPNGDAEEGGIAFCGRGGVIQDGLVLTILFLGCIVQVRGTEDISADTHTNTYKKTHKHKTVTTPHILAPSK